MSLYSTLLRNTAQRLLLVREQKHAAMAQWKFLLKSQYWPRQRLLDYQWQRLSEMLKHAYDTTAYYRRVFDERGLTPDSFKSVDDLRKLPVLTRDLIDAHRTDLISSKFTEEHLQVFGTGGTTTRRLTLYRDKIGATMKQAVAWRFEGFMGQMPGDKVSIFWPPHIDFHHHHSWLTHVKDRYLQRMQLFYTGGATADTLERFYRDFRSFGPRYIKCFPGGLLAFTEYALARQLPLEKVKGIMSTGEMLYPSMRELFERAYQAPVYDMYGSREVGNTSCECRAHEGHHIAAEIAVVEFVRDGIPVGPGEDGEILVTDLTNYGFPMIRYELSDVGRPLEATCSCGRSLPLMTAGVGRLSDFYVALDGTRRSGLVLGVQITETGPPMGKTQIIQRTLTDWHVKITNDPPATPELQEHIRTCIKNLIGEAVTVSIEIVDDIPPEKSGKLRYFKCEIPS
ncbi:MAG: hypothetical protein RBT76_08455 [candidate division Zixibacteria bacterium]|jgi:phenylacetate-CoA ligase|nr:hypothetical protein [candidate division Zixibacteria bacterium]